MVLLIACANVANLLLVRVEGRRQELAVRARWAQAAHASPRSFARKCPSRIPLAVRSGWASPTPPLRVLAPSPRGLPRVREIGLDGGVLLFTLLISLLASIMFASIPIFKYAGVRLSTGIARRPALSQSKEQHRPPRSVLVGVQVALALRPFNLPLGLMISQLSVPSRASILDSPARRFATFRISIPSAMVKENEQVFEHKRDLAQARSGFPGVGSAGVVSMLPMDRRRLAGIPSSLRTIRMPEGRTSSAPHSLDSFRPEYLGTGSGTPLVAGRGDHWNDAYEKFPSLWLF